MTYAQLEVLRQEISERVSVETIASRDTQAIAEELNVGRTGVVDVPASMVRGYLYALGCLAGITAKANAARANADSSQVALACQALYDLSIADQPVPMSNPVIAGRVAADLQLMVDADPPLLTSQQMAMVLALATQPDPVSEFDVRRACWSDDGQWML